MPHPTAPTKKRSALVASITLLRAAMVGICLLIVDELIPLGTSSTVLFFASTVGVALSSLLATSRLTSRGFFTTAAIAFIGGYLLFAAIAAIPFGESHLWWYAHVLHLQMIAFIFALAAISTFLFW